MIAFDEFDSHYKKMQVGFFILGIISCIFTLSFLSFTIYTFIKIIQCIKNKNEANIKLLVCTLVFIFSTGKNIYQYSLILILKIVHFFASLTHVLLNFHLSEYVTIFTDSFPIIRKLWIEMVGFGLLMYILTLGVVLLSW